MTQANDGPAEQSAPDGVVVPFRRREVEVQLPDVPPVITPSVATALLRLLLNAHQATEGKRAA
ncbi:hypothetical protein JOF56_009930 [Kibdelosporangium banguiense]|uniref:FXSXX-COOH protein n=1 Tax=Kibdelosporangium banguiense TaxID=1365924 RepID=A0ABS4TYR7_9PSEU|nr:hypothetical protein [Kibdelosporangium banguiense]MBP2329545.1 hypothetical protein [Kibdelosporangium banguiense]